MATFLALFAAWRLRPSPRAPASVVLILVDTLRADHLGLYGYPRPTSPQLDRLAASSVVFEQARSVAPWTNPTIASIFTGRHPHALVDPVRHAQAIRQRLPDAIPTLAEKLAAAGHRTLAFVDHPGISPGLGFARGFDTFVHLFKQLETPIFGRPDGERMVSEIAGHFPGLADEPFFVYVHLIFPHRPYDPPPEHAERFGATSNSYRYRNRQKVVNAYDAEIRFTDDVVAALVRELARAGLRDETWIVFTSDHGEGFWEHGRDEHGNSFYDELLRVPLLLSPPPRSAAAPRRITTPVSLIDLHDTVLDLAGLGPGDGDDGTEGSSLLRHLRRFPRAAGDDSIAQQPHGGDVRGTALVRWPWKLIRRQEDGRPPLQLYDLEQDPEERRDRSGQMSDLASRLDEALGRHLAADRAALHVARESTGEIDLDQETIERLKALGYLN